MNYKKEIKKIPNYMKYVMPYREKGYAEHEALALGMLDMKKDEEGEPYYEITKSSGNTRHTEQCIRFGLSGDCPACGYIELEERKAERKALKEIRRYKHASEWRK